MTNNKISKPGFLLATSNTEKAKNLYETVLKQKAIAEIPGYLVDFGNFGLQFDYKGYTEGAPAFAKKPTGAKIEVKTKSDNCQLVFDVENLDYWVAKIKATEGIEILHDVVEYHWGQRVFRFYDHDKHIVELGESSVAMAKRLQSQGLSAEEMAKLWDDSVENVQSLLATEVTDNKIGEAGMILAVSDLTRAQHFYETLLEQKVKGVNPDYVVVFEDGLYLQCDYAGTVAGTENYAPQPTGAKINPTKKANNCQIAFEVADLDYWVAKIKATEGIEFLHDVVEYDWGQRTIKFYDYDGHIVEIGEELAIVAKRYLSQGMSVEEVAKHFEFSLEFVKGLVENNP